MPFKAHFEKYAVSRMNMTLHQYDNYNWELVQLVETKVPTNINWVDGVLLKKHIYYAIKPLIRKEMTKLGLMVNQPICN